MSEEDSDNAATDSQTEDGELPVIQLCGLVEELRYRHRGPLRPQLQPADHPGLCSTPRERSPLREEGTSLPACPCFLPNPELTSLSLMEPGQGGGARESDSLAKTREDLVTVELRPGVSPWCPAAALPVCVKWPHKPLSKVCMTKLNGSWVETKLLK